MLTSKFNIDFANDMFKFRSLVDDKAEERITDIIVNKRLYIPKVSELNDHLEDTIVIDTTQYKLIHNVLMKYPTILTDLFDQITTIFKTLQCVSFSKFANGLDLYSSPMWGLYSNNGKGVAIVIEKDESMIKVEYDSPYAPLFKNQTEQNKCLRELQNFANKTTATHENIKKFKNATCDVSGQNFILPLDDNMTAYTKKTIKRNIGEKILHKHPDWSYEREYRSIYSYGHTENKKRIKIVGVIVGPKYTPITWFENLLVNEKIPVMQFKHEYDKIQFCEY